MTGPDPLLVACTNCGAMTPATAEACLRCRMPLTSAEGATAPRRSAGRALALFLGLGAAFGVIATLAAVHFVTGRAPSPRIEAAVASAAAPGGGLGLAGTPRTTEAKRLAMEPVARPSAPAPTASEAAAPPATPSASAEDTASTSGTLPRETIRRIIQQNRNRFRACYERGLAADPNLAGRVKVRFVIRTDGSVADVTDAGSDLPNRTVVACVLRAFESIRFPSPEGGSVTVIYPLAFTSE